MKVHTHVAYWQLHAHIIIPAKLVNMFSSIRDSYFYVVSKLFHQILLFLRLSRWNHRINKLTKAKKSLKKSLMKIENSPVFWSRVISPFSAHWVLKAQACPTSRSSDLHRVSRSVRRNDVGITTLLKKLYPLPRSRGAKTRRKTRWVREPLACDLITIKRKLGSVGEGQRSERSWRQDVLCLRNSLKRLPRPMP